MSITKILKDKEATAEAKLEAVAEVVANARQNYGNADEKIAVPTVGTTHGSMGFDMLEADSKVELLRNETMRIKAEAVEYAENNQGVNLNKKIEELISVNGMFCNIDAGKKFEYI